jgi:GR25 family glycosyltransferase involved in LPS biosynthesis
MSMIRVISLTSTPERRRRFAEAHEGVGFAFFDAIDGRTAAHTPFLHVPHTHGAIGCALSHLALWRLATTTGETLTIAEDDAILRHDFEVASAVAMARAPRDWHIIVWEFRLGSVSQRDAGRSALGRGLQAGADARIDPSVPRDDDGPCPGAARRVLRYAVL